MNVLTKARVLLLCLWSMQQAPSSVKYTKEYTQCLDNSWVNEQVCKGIWKNPPGWWKKSCWEGPEPNIWPGLPVPPLLHKLPGTYICLTPVRKRRHRRDLGTSPSLAHLSVLCDFRSGVAWVGKDGCSVLGNEWMGQHLPAPWLKLGCLILLFDVVCTSQKCCSWQTQRTVSSRSQGKETSLSLANLQ